MYEDISFSISLDCIEEPYFSDTKNRGGNLNLISPQFTFPLSFILSGKVMGFRRFRPYMPLINDGDKETGLEIKVIAKYGEAKNIKIILNNKEFIKVDVDLKRWDVLQINTNPRKKAVTLNGENIINKINRNSTFFSLAQGKNIINYECDEGASNLDIEVNFYGKYLGM